MFLIYLLIILILLALFYIWSIKPNKKRDTSGFLGRLYAHRGLHDNLNKNPENSFLAFEMAVEEDYGIELDVQVTKDTIPVIFHDDTLIRACGLETCIGDYSLEELKKINLFNSQEKIPSLQEVLDLVDGKVPLIVEIKNYSRDIGDIEYIAQVLDKYKGLYCVESFNPLSLIWYKENRPQIIRGQLSSYFKKKGHSFSRRARDILLENFMTNFLTKPDFLGFNHKFKDMLSFKLCKTLYDPLTIAYTIKSENALQKSKNDFDLFIFDSFIPKKRP